VQCLICTSYLHCTDLYINEFLRILYEFTSHFLNQINLNNGIYLIMQKKIKLIFITLIIICKIKYIKSTIIMIYTFTYKISFGNNCNDFISRYYIRYV